MFPSQRGSRHLHLVLLLLLPLLTGVFPLLSQVCFGVSLTAVSREKNALSPNFRSSQEQLQGQNQDGSENFSQPAPRRLESFQ